MIPHPPPVVLPEPDHLRTSIDDAVRSILRDVPQTADPDEIRAALAAAGLNLPAALVESWLDHLHRNPERNPA